MGKGHSTLQRMRETLTSGSEGRKRPQRRSFTRPVVGGDVVDVVADNLEPRVASDRGKEQQWAASPREANEPSNEPGSHHAAGFFCEGLLGVDQVLHAELRRRSVFPANGHLCAERRVRFPYVLPLMIKD